MKELWDYIRQLFQEHRATRNALIEKGKTYRSHDVAFENGYATAIHDIQDYLRKPEREAELKEAVKAVAQKLEG